MSVNKYDLNEEYQAKTDIIIELNVHYSIDTDQIRIDYGQRNDVKSDDLLFRSAVQVEHAFRHKSKMYAESLAILEAEVGITDSEDCGCTVGAHG